MRSRLRPRRYMTPSPADNGLAYAQGQAADCQSHYSAPMRRESSPHARVPFPSPFNRARARQRARSSSSIKWPTSLYQPTASARALTRPTRPCSCRCWVSFCSTASPAHLAERVELTSPGETWQTAKTIRIALFRGQPGNEIRYAHVGTSSDAEFGKWARFDIGVSGGGEVRGVEGGERGVEGVMRA